MHEAGLSARDLAAVGITNQRETTLLWDRRTGAPVHNALVWQDTRVEPLVAAFAHEGGQDRFRAQTGLPLASYFSGLKLRGHVDKPPITFHPVEPLRSISWNVNGVHTP